MLLPSGLFCCPFTCVDASGTPLAPAATPTACLVKNGTDTAVSVTVTMNAAQGIASCTIPANAVPGDCWHLRITTAGFTLSGPVMTTGTVALTPAERNALAGAVRSELAPELACLDVSLSTRLAADDAVALTPAERNALAGAVRSELAPELACLDVSLSTRLAADDFVAAPTVEEIASSLLIDPAHPILTNSSGQVTATNGGGTSGGPTFVLPLRSTSVERMTLNRIDLFTREQFPLVIPIYDEKKQPVDCTGLTCTLHATGGIEVPGLLPTAMTTGGVPHRYEFTPPLQMTSSPGSLRFSLRVTGPTKQVLAYGQIVVADVP